MVTAILASVAELERSVICERTKAGIAAARANGAKIGRPRVIADDTIRAGVGLVQEKGMTIAEAAKAVGISYPTLAMALRTQ
jgi:DNA invertase Pin-like site-specific DNA recombinase